MLLFPLLCCWPKIIDERDESAAEGVDFEGMRISRKASSAHALHWRMQDNKVERHMLSVGHVPFSVPAVSSENAILQG